MRSPGLGLLCVSVSACSMFMHSIERPTVTVRDVSMSSASLAGVSGEIRLDVMNPNGFGVPLSGMDWQLSIGGARALTGTVQLSETIPARGVAPITAALAIATTDAVAVGSMIAGGRRDYEVTARLHFSAPIGQVDVDVKHTGTLGGGSAIGFGR